MPVDRNELDFFQYQFIREQVQTNNKHQSTHHMFKLWEENKPHNNSVYFVPRTSEIALNWHIVNISFGSNAQQAVTTMSRLFIYHCVSKF